MELKEQVFREVSKIPKGKVTTYAEIGKKLKIHPRAVGAVLKCNTQLNRIQCYKVIKSNGLVGNYRLGQKEKIKRLKNEGIIVINKKINLKKYLYQFK